GLVAIGLLSLSACGGPVTSAESTEATNQADTQVGLYCFLRAWKPGAQISNASYATLNCDGGYRQLEVCMQQYVNGSWSNMDWTCQTFPNPARNNLPTIISEQSLPVPYYTVNRAYRTWAWGWNSWQGQTYSAATLSNICYGNGGQGCN